MSRRAIQSAQRPVSRRSTDKQVTTTFAYIESSALLAALLEKDNAARKSLRVKRRPRITSALTFAECSRALVRARIAGRITPADERVALRWLQTFRLSCDVVAITEAVLARAGRPFAVEPIRTLDAIHLATAELLGEPPQLVTIVTRDDRIIENAKALGYAVE